MSSFAKSGPLAERQFPSFPMLDPPAWRLLLRLHVKHNELAGRWASGPPIVSVGKAEASEASGDAPHRVASLYTQLFDAGLIVRRDPRGWVSFTTAGITAAIAARESQ